MLSLPEVRVGDPIRYESISVFPLEANGNGRVTYLLSDEALTAGSVTVEEVGEGGTVPELVVNNQSDSLVLFLEGEELRGAKQNRVLNTSVLIAAKSKLKIPVSCVEQGRWRYSSRHFASGGYSSGKLRHILRKTVAASVTAGRGHGSDQGAVWGEVARQADHFCASSETMAMADTYESYRERLAEFKNRLKYIEGARGLAVAIGKKVVSIDLFDKPATCQKIWDRLLSGLVMDALETKQVEEPVEKADAEKVLQVFRDSSWKQTPAIGTGEEYRSATEDDKHASALVYKDAVVHGSLVVAG